MGSFNATCIVSNLPIQARDPVRYLALTESKYHPPNKWSCYVHGRWQLRTVPLRAKYNDYGSVEDILPGLVEQVFFKSFDGDVVEKGVGDNQCHDVPVRKGMSQHKWLEALWEGRVFVGSQRPELKIDPEKLHEVLKRQDDARPKGIPTFARLEALLKKNDLPVTTKYGERGFVLDEVSPGFLRIRFGRSTGEMKPLEKLIPILVKAGYSAMLTCGTGHYPNEGEVLVAPRPMKEGEHHFTDGLSPQDDRNRPLGVSLAMIREDVWQALLNTKLDHWRYKNVSIDKFRTLANKLFCEDIVFTEKLERMEPMERLRAELDHQLAEDNFEAKDRNFLRDFLRPGSGVTGFSLKQAYELAKGIHKSTKEMEPFLNDLAETLYVEWVYGELHGQWHPTTNSGQDGNWRLHRDFLRKLDGIAQTQLEESERG